MRIRELAERSGVSVRTIRFYHQLGILQRPRVEGRVGFYGQEHEDRLTLVRRLQRRGYSLAAVADFVASQGPAILLEDAEPRDATTAVWDGADPHRLTLAQLVEMIPLLATQTSLVDRMVKLGLLVPEGDEAFGVPQPPLLRAGILMAHRGVPVATALDELGRLREDLERIADRFAGIVEQDMLPGRRAGTGVDGPVPGDAGEPATDGAPSVAVAAADGQHSLDETLAVDLVRHVWPAVLVAVGQVLTDATRQAVLTRLPGPVR